MANVSTHGSPVMRHEPSCVGKSHSSNTVNLLINQHGNLPALSNRRSRLWRDNHVSVERHVKNATYTFARSRMKSSTRVNVIGNSLSMALVLKVWSAVSVHTLNDIRRLNTG